MKRTEWVIHPTHFPCHTCREHTPEANGFTIHNLGPKCRSCKKRAVTAHSKTSITRPLVLYWLCEDCWWATQQNT